MHLISLIRITTIDKVDVSGSGTAHHANQDAKPLDRIQTDWADLANSNH